MSDLPLLVLLVILAPVIAIGGIALLGMWLEAWGREGAGK